MKIRFLHAIVGLAISFRKELILRDSVYVIDLHDPAVHVRGPSLVIELPRQPGTREARWMHLLSGAPDITEKASAPGAPEPDRVGLGEIAALRAETARLSRAARDSSPTTS